MLFLSQANRTGSRNSVQDEPPDLVIVAFTKSSHMTLALAPVVMFGKEPAQPNRWFDNKVSGFRLCPDFWNLPVVRRFAIALLAMCADL
jgi:hypothetical protein